MSSIDPTTGDAVGHTLAEMLKDQCRPLEQKRKVVFPLGADGLYRGQWGHAIEELHEIGEGLIPIFLLLHVGAVVLHAFSGRHIWRKMIFLKE